ncbi:MAG: transcription antitermination factor NusB [Candidatus Taylorbacteria bacterium RIFOXYD2_FULL_36_9]|uniref:Transcription antitermination protein NusB n=1 Tax=Candidatus Taylorbacteria bacterium RIFOXYD2_FULL_36_9 TaxID=1802338 RepID=A0A1G2PF87_9BACT|nr:MAG: transcription antitermination factor NusB [Candidatus Taylorbacteria bacterium RIFOXYD2_FULL_36_9]
MANRHIARSIVLQTLFELDFRDYSDSELPEEILIRNASEFAQDVVDMTFVQSLLSGVLGKKEEIDLVIQKAAPDWPLDKISIMDRNVLRIGLYELLFADAKEVPAKVAINESIELSKNYGGEKSSKFVNGVLGSVYKELGEPDKDAVSKKKKKTIIDVPYEDMPIEKLGGAVVYACDSEDNYYLALVHDVFGYWTLSKGRLEPEEKEKDGTKREIKEEIGLEVEVLDEIGRNEYVANHPEKGKLRKQVVYFLAKAEYKDLILEKDSGGLDEARWFRLSEIQNIKTYGDILPFITKAITLISREK